MAKWLLWKKKIKIRKIKAAHFCWNADLSVFYLWVLMNYKAKIWNKDKFKKQIMEIRAFCSFIMTFEWDVLMWLVSGQMIPTQRCELFWKLRVSILSTSSQCIFVRIFITSKMLFYDPFLILIFFCPLYFQDEIRAFRRWLLLKLSRYNLSNADWLG